MDQNLVKQILNHAIYGLEEKYPQYSSRLFLSNRKKVFCFIVLILINLLLIDNEYLLNLAFLILNLIYLTCHLSKFIYVISSFKPLPEQFFDFNNQDFKNNLPKYSILLPVYREERVVKKLINGIKNLDYPKNLLDVQILIDEDDHSTLSAINEIDLPSFIKLTIMPLADPRTKPKACNYGLYLSQGDYIVIYDAEDIPEPDQLLKAVAKFKKSDPYVVCLQAKLKFFNYDNNSLTKCFFTEYDLLFEQILYSLKKFSMPIPLGGTSNHFKKDKLIELGAWDAFNVTEDADLGLRIYQYKYRTELLDTITFEEAPIDIISWINQRSRWIKGQLITGLLHLKNLKNFSNFEVIGILTTLLFPNIMYSSFLFYLVLFFSFEYYKVFAILWQTNFAFNIILPIFYTSFSMQKNKKKLEIKVILYSVLYYMLFPIAGLKALVEIFIVPFKWNKTQHGISK